MSLGPIPAPVVIAFVELLGKGAAILLSGRRDSAARLRRGVAALAAEKTGKAAGRAIIDS